MNAKKLSTESSFSDISKEQLISNFKTVLSDAEDLLKATANHGGEALAAVRAKTEESLGMAKAGLADAEAELMSRSKAAVKATDRYVHKNPWQATGIAVGIGLLVGVLLGRR